NLLGLYPLRIQEAETGLRAIEIMKKQAATALNWTKVCAPFDGIVAKVYMEVGESVGSGLGGDIGGGSALSMGGGLAGAGGLSAGAGMGAMSIPSPMAVAHIVDDSDIYVKAPFDEANFGRVSVGDKVRVTVDAYRDEEFPGKVSYIAPIVSKNMDLSRTFEVEILIEQGKEKLITGMSADVVVITEEKDDVLLVPSEALVREEEGYVIKDGRAEKRLIKVGIGNWLEREVLDGVKEGETLITSITIKELKDGCKVNIVESLEAK
ncbi:MAG TPA: efflux RND transporter periplasmic adaptor subunit, partial [Candidatus Hydrogenedentes bacterium]|nr:efflux RND transporter periplasmic adaptor subunit [Candidatus Hydrogenedentota bacterium]